MLSSPRKPSRTIRIFSSAEYFFRVFRRISRTVFSGDTFDSLADSFHGNSNYQKYLLISTLILSGMFCRDTIIPEADHHNIVIPKAMAWIPGDVNHDSSVNVGDPVYLINISMNSGRRISNRAVPDPVSPPPGA